MTKCSYVTLIAASLSLLACGQAESNASESGNSVDTAQDQPTQISTWIEDKKRECASEGFEFERADNFLRTADFNADGKTDYILWDGGVVCEGRPASWFGNAGPPLTFLVSYGDDYGFYEGFSFYDLDELPMQRENGKDIIKLSDEQQEVIWYWDGAGISMRDAAGEARAYEWSVEENNGMLFAELKSPVHNDYSIFSDIVFQCETEEKRLSVYFTDLKMEDTGDLGEEVSLKIEGINLKLGWFEIVPEDNYARVELPLESDILSALIEGKSPLRIEFSGYPARPLPYPPIFEVGNNQKFQLFLTQCIERPRS